MLEQTENQTEQVKPLSEVEAVKPVSDEKGKEVSKTTLTFDQKHIDGLLQTKEKEWQSRKDKEFAQTHKEYQQKLSDLQRQSDETRLAALEGKELEQLGDGKEVKDFQQLRRELLRKEAILREAETEWNTHLKRGNAALLAEEYGVETKSLLEAKSPSEMVELAKQGKMTRLETELNLKKAEIEEAKKAPQKIDSGTLSGAGVSWRDDSSDDKVRKGLAKLTK